MNKLSIAFAVAAGIALGGIAQAKLPPPPPKSDAEKAAEASKAAAAKAKDAELLNKYSEKAVANYKRNKGSSSAAKPASQSGKP